MIVTPHVIKSHKKVFIRWIKYIKRVSKHNTYRSGSNFETDVPLCKFYPESILQSIHIFTAAGIVPCCGCETFPAHVYHNSADYIFWSFEIIENIQSQKDKSAQASVNGRGHCCTFYNSHELK